MVREADQYGPYLRGLSLLAFLVLDLLGSEEPADASPQ